MSQSISLFDLTDYFSSYLNHISHIALRATVHAAQFFLES